jgi:hypothetical protein
MLATLFGQDQLSQSGQAQPVKRTMVLNLDFLSPGKERLAGHTHGGCGVHTIANTRLAIRCQRQGFALIGSQVFGIHAHIVNANCSYL